MRAGVRLTQLLSALLVFCSLLFVQAAHASDDGPIRVLALESDSCFSVQRFIKQLESRLIDRSIVSSTRSPSELEVRVLRQGDSFEAELFIQLPGGTPRSRTISAPSCEEASDAIAFVAAVALDDDSELPTERPTTATTWSGQLLVGANLLVGALPMAAVGPQASLFLTQVKPGLWSPALALGVQYFRNGNVATDTGTAKFELVEGTIDLCPSLARFKAMGLRPCAYGSFGQLAAAGRATLDPQKSRRFYATAGADLLLFVELGSRFLLSAHGFATFPLIRDSFQFGDETFHEVPLVTYGLGAHFGIRLF